MPFLVRWPDMVPAGTVCEEPIICLDITPTICAVAGVDLPSDREYDGADMLPSLQGAVDGTLHEALFWRDDGGQWAVRSGDRELLGNRQGDVELYNLRSDLGERTNVVAQEPAIAERLRHQYEGWSATLAPRIKRRRRKEAG